MTVTIRVNFRGAKICLGGLDFESDGNPQGDPGSCHWSSIFGRQLLLFLFFLFSLIFSVTVTNGVACGGGLIYDWLRVVNASWVIRSKTQKK